MLLTRRAQAHFAVSFNYCLIFSSIKFENNLSYYLFTYEVGQTVCEVEEIGGTSPPPVEIVVPHKQRKKIVLIRIAKS